MSSIKEVLTKINEKRAEASIDLDTINPKNRAGVSGLIRAAQRELVELEKAYSEAVLKSTKILAINGDRQGDLVRLADEANLLTIDFNGAEAEILANIRSRLPIGKEDNAEFESNLNFIFVDELARFRSKYDITTMPEPNKHDRNAVLGRNYKEAVSLILDQNYGNALRSAYTRVAISRKAVAKNISTDVVPVVLFNAAGDIDTAFLPSPVMAAEIAADTTPEQMQSIAGEFAKLLVPKQTNKGQSARKTKEI